MLDRGLARSRPFVVALAALTLLGSSAAAAGAAGNASSSCAVPQATAQPFLPWNDQGSYFLVPGGSFEGPSPLAGWSTSGQAAVVSGNESYQVGQPTDSQSLSLADGSAATTPGICVSIFTPDLRLFSLNNGGPASTLEVFVNYTDRSGNPQTALVSTLTGGNSWSLSPRLLFLNNIAATVGGQGQTQISLTFQATGGNWQIDDLYIDPIKSQGSDSCSDTSCLGNTWS